MCPSEANVRLSDLERVDRQGQLTSALADYDVSIRLKPDASAHYNRGSARMANQDWAGAAADFEAGIRLAPEVVNNYIGLCGALYSQGDLDASIAAFEKALEIAPNDEYAARNLARVQLQKQQS